MTKREEKFLFLSLNKSIDAKIHIKNDFIVSLKPLSNSIIGVNISVPMPTVVIMFRNMFFIVSLQPVKIEKAP